LVELSKVSVELGGIAFLSNIFRELLAIIFIVVGAFFAYNYIVGADSVSAPDVRNKTLEEAKVVFKNAHLPKALERVEIN